MSPEARAACGLVAVALVAAMGLYGRRVGRLAGAESAGTLFCASMLVFALHALSKALALPGWVPAAPGWSVLLQVTGAAMGLWSVHLWARAMVGETGELTRLRARIARLETEAITARLRLGEPASG